MSGREPAVAAAHLEHPAAPEVAQPAQGAQVRSFRVEDRCHGRPLMLGACTP